MKKIGLLFRILFLLALPATADAQDYTYITNNGTITITGYTGPGGVVTIPSTITGLPVTSIGDLAFYRVYSLTNVTIPNGVTNIGNQAFYICYSLSSVTIPNSVISIGESAFYHCIALTSANIPDGVKSIGIYAFFSCTSMTNVIIPDSVTNIGGWAFANLNSLTAFNVSASNSVYSSLNGVLFNSSTATLIQFPGGLAGSYTIPDIVTSIGLASFYHSGLTNVTIPEGVTNISFFVFAYSDGLTSVTIPKSVTNIDQEAFAYCPNLTATFFQGDAPPDTPYIFDHAPTTAYYLPGTTGWGATFSGNPAVLWNPTMQTTDGNFGVQNNSFGFNVTGTTNIPIVVEATKDLANPSWTTLQNCTLTNGSIYFADTGWTNFSSRCYRIRSP